VIYVILAPHPDDEIIGCFELIKENPKDVVVVHFKKYAGNTEEMRRFRINEAVKVADKYGFNHTVRDSVITLIVDDMFWKIVENEAGGKENVAILVPDLRDNHEHHRLVNSAGYIIAKRYGFRFGEYTTRMNTEYVRECKYPDEKLEAIKMYKSQSWLWEIGDAKWWIFEGRRYYE